MSLAVPPHQLPTSSAGSCPPSPPPVFSVTSAFFQSPFSVSNRNSPTHLPRNVPPNFCGPLSPSPMCAGLKYQRLIAKEGEENEDHQSSYGLSWKPPKTRLSSDWTPLSSKSSPSNQTYLQDRHPVSTEDRLDRILAEMRSVSPSKSIRSSGSNLPRAHPVECWELSSLETRFHPVHASITSTTLRPCLKTRSTSISSASSSDQSSDQSCDPAGAAQPETCLAVSDHNLDHRSFRVRFDEDKIEEFLTWSRESYDRKGPQPIVKLNLREILELKMIKEELGISSCSKSSCSPSACFSSQ